MLLRVFLCVNRINLGMDPDSCKDYDQRNGLHLSVCNQRKEIVEILLKKTTNNYLILHEDRWGNSALDECENIIMEAGGGGTSGRVS